jgi:hypothetical protein
MRPDIQAAHNALDRKAQRNIKSAWPIQTAFKQLPEVVPTATVVAIAPAASSTATGAGGQTLGMRAINLLVLTEDSLWELEGGGLLKRGPVESKHYPLQDVTEVSIITSGVVTTKRLLRVTSKRGPVAEMRIYDLLGGDQTFQYFSGTLAARHASLSAAEPDQRHQGPPLSSVADELLKLTRLRDLGALTDAEFESQKAKLLASE